MNYGLRIEEDFVQKVKNFNQIAGTIEEFNPAKISLYTALILEEVGELIESYNSVKLKPLAELLDGYSTAFKQGLYNDVIPTVDRVEFLDASVDIAVVSIGAGISIGADIEGACHHVADNNLTKFPIIDGVRTVLKDPVSGKVKKPDNYIGPNLEPFIK
jgi:predicted HAD superfamily Cof-like phosphohydrolase